MKTKLAIPLFLFFNLFFQLYTFAQQSVNAAGGNTSGSGGAVSYSVGQVAYNSYSGSQGSMAQGIQQAYELITVGLPDTQRNISLSAFPNPTAGDLSLQIANYQNEVLSYSLYDAQGKLIAQANINAALSTVQTARLAAGSYFLQIQDAKNQKIQSFQINKK
jgi:hypothetical protein